MGQFASRCSRRNSDTNDRGDEAKLIVTPSLSVPWSRLPTEACRKRIWDLARRECAKGLVDDCATFPFAEDTHVLADGHPHGFIAAATAAWAHHYPFSVRPQHFWMMILQAIAVHVDLNAEEVRDKWVAHEGKKHLNVSCDDFVLGVSGNDWASVVEGRPDSFSSQIDENVVVGLVQQLIPTFSGTTAEENIALKITVMDACKSFFSYGMTTCCGFPSVTMEGSLEDWRLLRVNAESLIEQRCAPKFAETWSAALLPLLDTFIQEYECYRADGKFWNSMCKRGGTSGSGARTWFNGWINIFFPYINRKLNPYMVPYSSSNGYVKEGREEKFYGMCGRRPDGVQGPDCVDFPKGLASAPVVWDYLGTEVELKFKAGFVGATQDKESGTIKPLVGWFIAHGGMEEKAPFL